MVQVEGREYVYLDLRTPQFQPLAHIILDVYMRKITLYPRAIL